MNLLSISIIDHYLKKRGGQNPNGLEWHLFFIERQVEQLHRVTGGAFK